MKIHLGYLFSTCLAVLVLFSPERAPAYVNEQAVLNNQGVTFPTQAKLGNIFVTGDKVQIEAAVAKGTSVDWAVTDYLNQKVATGRAKVADGKVTIEPSATGLGFYLVKVTAKDGMAIRGTGLTSYAVIPVIDNSKMASARFGVASHFGKNMKTDLAPVLAEAGIAHVRDGMDWHWIETVPGKYDFTIHDFIGRMADLKKNHIIPMIFTAFGDPLHYDDPDVPLWAAAPHTPEQYAAYTQFNIAHLKQFGTQIQALEIWNEYNGSFCKGVAATDRPKYYTEMLKDAYKGIKAERPDVQVLGGALNGIPLPYVEKLFKDGALDAMDGIVIHPYGGTPESMEAKLHQLVDLMKKYNNGVAKPIWATELGDWDDHTVVRAEAAARLTRMYAMLLDQPEVARAYWYLARDYEEFPTEGLVHSETDPMGKYTPSANYPAFATMANLLFDATPKGHVATDSRTTIHHFEKNGQGIWVAWAVADTANIVFETKTPLRRINMVGGEIKLTPTDGKVTVKLNDQPIYFVADNAADVTSVTETPRADQVVTDSFTDYGGQQGQNSWGYYWFTSNHNGSAAYQSDKLQEMNYTVTPGDWQYVWSGPGDWFVIGADEAQPAVADGNQLWSVRRWTSTVDGAARVSGDIKRGEKGDGTGFKIFVDGKEIYSKLIPSKGEVRIDQGLTLKKGSKVDFVMTPGPAADKSFDSCHFHVVISTTTKK